MVGRLKRFIFRKKKLVILVVGVGVLAGLLFFAVQSLSKPAEGTVNQAVSQPLPEVPIALNDFTSRYFVTKYSSRYELQINQNKSASLESWILLAHQALGMGAAAKIGVSVTKLPAGGVKEDGAYKQFEAFPNFYTITKAIYKNDEVIVADRSDPNFEQTALWAHGAYLATFSMTSGQKNDQLVSELNIILSNLTWTNQQKL